MLMHHVNKSFTMVDRTICAEFPKRSPRLYEEIKRGTHLIDVENTWSKMLLS
ncbi:uncharacterized protein E5676_scaffold208G001500 [Cucumis melo var. makuwa]|uniref:Uncharacterized protein n=1 Tax=Cucumis melo var. makuwa TaxID=1194695 RepID=A0A5D3E1Z1_CUCMM|nr:uncharacterized protein E6C27_scaffold160G00530 [Cucumis melo var. makuwa]TYK29894.1 uncharacterized protein E5676_scaffold208G001500 [Cucumis melo var. makuwa]